MNAAAALLAAVEIGEPLTRGSLSLFPLFHERGAARRYITGPRSEGHIRVGEVPEGAIVPELEIVNDSHEPVLFLDGETLLGGRQNRIVTVSVLVPARGTSRVSVTCVEAGRWGDERPVGRSARLAPSGVRARNMAHSGRTVMAGGKAEADQSGVWEEVGRYARVLGAESSTQAMEDVHEHAAGRVHALVGGTSPLPGQCGVAAAVGERIIAVDLFDDPRTLSDYWDALVAGYALDAGPESSGHPSRRTVRRVLGEVGAARAVTAGGRVHIGADRVTATALLLDDRVVHLAVTVGGEPAPRPSWFSS